MGKNEHPRIDATRSAHASLGICFVGQPRAHTRDHGRPLALRRPLMWLPRLACGSLVSHVAPSSRYVAPSSRCVAPSSRCLAPSSRYVAPSSRCVAPSSRCLARSSHASSRLVSRAARSSRSCSSLVSHVALPSRSCCSLVSHGVTAAACRCRRPPPAAVAAERLPNP